MLNVLSLNTGVLPGMPHLGVTLSLTAFQFTLHLLVAETSVMETRGRGEGFSLLQVVQTSTM